MIKRIKEQLFTEYQRYKKSRYGKIVALLIYYIIFTTSPIIVRNFVPLLRTRFSDDIIAVLLTVGTIFFTEVSWCLFMLIVYKLNTPFFEQYRVNPQKAWPWQENKGSWHKLLLRSLGITYFHIIVFVPINLVIATKLGYSLIIQPAEMPNLSWMLPQFIIMMFLEDTIFFWFHWALHHPLLYKIHKVHHQFTTSISLAGFHFHLIEFFLIQSLSFLINSEIAKLYGPLHISTIISWFFFRTWDANSAHSGYNFSWAPLQLLPFCTNQDFHDFHHSNNSGNYASHFRFWDCIFGTNQQFRQFKLHQLEKSRIKKND